MRGTERFITVNNKYAVLENGSDTEVSFKIPRVGKLF